MDVQCFPSPWPVLPCVLWPYSVSSTHACGACMGKLVLEDDCSCIRGGLWDKKDEAVSWRRKVMKYCWLRHVLSSYPREVCSFEKKNQ